MIKNLVYNNTINEYFFEQKLKEIDTTFCGKKLNFLNSVLPYHKQIKNKLLLKTLFLETIREEHISNISDDLLEMVQDIYNKNINLDEFQEFELNSIFSLLKKDINRTIQIKASIDHFKQINLTHTIPIWFFIKYEEYQKYLLECHLSDMLIDSALDDDEFNIFLNLDFLNSSQKNEILTLNHIMLNKCNQSTIKKSINDKTIVFNEEFVLNLNMSDIDINFIFDENMINLNDLSFRSKTLIIGNPTLKEIYKNKLINDDHNLSNFINIDTSYFLDKDNLFFLIKNRRWLVEPWNHPALNKDLIAISSFLLLDIKYNGIVDNNEPYSYRIMKYLKYLSIDTDLYDRELKQCNDIKKAILNITNLSMVYESINILYDQPVFYQIYQVIQEYNNKVLLDHHIDFV